MKKSPEVMIAILDLIIAGRSMMAAAKACGVSPATWYRWIAGSAETPDEYLVDWGPFGVAPLATHVRTANRGCLAGLESEIFARVAGTSDAQLEPVFFGGRPQWKEREDIIAAGHQNEPPDMLMMLYGQPDIYERDANGQRVQHYIRRAPSDALTLALMRAKLPKSGWGDHKSIDLQVSGGVHVVGRRPTPPTLPPPPMVDQIIEQVIEEEVTTASEEEADAQLSPSIEPPHEEAEPEVAEISSTLDPTSVGEADMADGTAEPPIVADLKKKLAETLAKAAAKAKTAPAAAPTAARYIPMSERGLGHMYAKRDGTDETEGVGLGHVRPGGAKMA